MELALAPRGDSLFASSTYTTFCGERASFRFIGASWWDVLN
jgi:hypothetical protein